MICEWDTAKFLIFSNNGEPLIYYSHLTSIVIFLALLGFTFLKLKPWPRTAFRFMALSYIIWLFCDLVLWGNEQMDNVMFFWTIINLVEPLIFVSAFSYFYQFSEGKPLSSIYWWGIFVLLLPTLIMAPIGLSVMGFDYTTCDRNAVEGVAAYYNYFLEALFLILVVSRTIWLGVTERYKNQKSKLLLMSGGTSLLLFSFLLANFLGTFTGDYVTSQYGHIAVPIFAAFLAYLTIRYESFEPRILLIDTLVVGIFVLLLSLIFVDNAEYQIYANSLALLIMIPLGYFLMSGIRKEVHTRKQIQQLATDLQASNDRQVSLIHFITHQIKGFVTKSRNAMAGILEGDYGQAPETMKPLIQQVFESDTQGVSTIQEILNASNIKSGKVTYNMQPFDLKDLIEEVVGTLRSNAEKKGLALNANLGDALTVTGDRAQLINAYKNIVDNSIKYTPKGSVSVSLEKKEGKALFTVTDTGVGITDEDKKNLFTEGGHGKESTKVNVDSTGFGLYIVKNIIEAHKGRVWAESDGPGKGSRFYIELPA